MSNSALIVALRSRLESNGLPIGTSLENKIIWRLHRWNTLGEFQYKVGRYRLDFAWPKKKIALEADGPYHRHPNVAVKDVIRDSWLRSQGWLVFRVDDTRDDLEEQLCRVARVINGEDEMWEKWPEWAKRA